MPRTSKKDHVLLRLAKKDHIMIRAVLLTAIDNHTAAICKMTEAEVAKSLGSATAFFSPLGWLEACREIQRELAK